MYSNNQFSEAYERTRGPHQSQSRQTRAGRHGDPPPDPPESGGPARSIYDRINERHGMPQHPSSMDSDRQGATGGGGYLPNIPSRLGLSASPGNAQGLLNQLSLSDLHKIRMHHEQQAALERQLQGMREAPWGNPGLSSPGPRLRQVPLEVMEAEDRWRISQGLPPRYGLASMNADRTQSRVRVNHNATAGYAGADGTQTEQQHQGGRHAVAASVTSGGAGAGGSLFDILATAAEGQLRMENQDNKKSGKKETRGRKRKNVMSDNTPRKDAAAILSAMNTRGAAAVPPKNSKRKRKGANEPKNPLGAFVFYQRKIMADVFEENPCITFGEAAAECGRRWKILNEEEKQQYKELAAKDKERYTKELEVFKANNGDGIINFLPENIVVPAKPKRKTKKMPGSANKKDETKRPLSAMAVYKAENIGLVRKEFPLASVREAATECEARFHKLDATEKARYESLAKHNKALLESEQGAQQNSDVQEKRPKRANRLGRTRSSLRPREEPAEPVSGDFEAEDQEMEKVINGWSPEAVKVPLFQEYSEMVDTNEYYMEETAWRYHNPPIPSSKGDEVEDVKITSGKQVMTSVTPEELRRLPPPPPLPKTFPTTKYCRWSFDEDTRVLFADFRPTEGNEVVITLEDEEFLLNMYERDDITVVSEGLFTGLDKDKWTLDYIRRVAGDEYFHKFRRFDKEKIESEDAAESKLLSGDDKPHEHDPQTFVEETSQDAKEHDDFVEVRHVEVDRCLSMKVSDFVTYLRLRRAALNDTKSVEMREITFLDHSGGEHTIDVTESVLYMIDFDMVKLLPTLHEDFASSFKIPGILPGGSHCMMNCVNSNGRPFMGPNCYITPPAAFTHFHQDGHGTVDSGHCCLSGFNEVVMLRRLPERHKRHALRFLTGRYKKNSVSTFEALYNLPHGDGLGEKPLWPDNEAIERCNEMNYCVSRFVLKPGQHVHINKGRLHAFRKVSNRALPPTDCHAALREILVRDGTNEKVVGVDKPELLCISVAWDWMYRGTTVSGMNREIVNCLECAALNRRYGVQSLAIPELSVLQMAKTLVPMTDENPLTSESLTGFQDESGDFTDKGYMPKFSSICKGIFGALQYVVKQHIYAMNHAENKKCRSFERCKRVSVASKPNAWENPLLFALDPHGNSDFFCKLCQKELSNVYLHCDGCELLLSKDFNICLECHQEKRYMRTIQMHPLNPKRHSTINHMGSFHMDRASRCPCKNGPVCKHCNFCAGCSCRCHTWFTLHCRFFNKDDELKLLHRVKHRVGREQIDTAEEVEQRLSMAVKGFIDENDRVNDPFRFQPGLHGMDIMDVSEASQFEDNENEENDDDGHNEESIGTNLDPKESVVSEPVDGDTVAAGAIVPDLAVPATSQTTRRNSSRSLPTSSHRKEGKDELATPTVEAKPRRRSRSSGADPHTAVRDFSLVDSKVSEEDADVEDDAGEDGPGAPGDDVPEDGNEARLSDENGGSAEMLKVKYNIGKWADEEKQRLEIALRSEPDIESVGKFVGTRRVPQIRSYADRHFPQLFESLKDRMAAAQMPKYKQKPAGPGKDSSEGYVDALGSGTPTTDTEVKEEEEQFEDAQESFKEKPESHRESEERKTSDTDAKKSEKETAGVKDEETKDSENGDDGTDSKRSDILCLSKKTGTLQTTQFAGGRSRRSTQDLSGRGRKRRASRDPPTGTDPADDCEVPADDGEDPAEECQGHAVQEEPLNGKRQKQEEDGESKNESDEQLIDMEG